MNHRIQIAFGKLQGTLGPCDDTVLAQVLQRLRTLLVQWAQMVEVPAGSTLTVERQAGDAWIPTTRLEYYHETNGFLDLPPVHLVIDTDPSGKVLQVRYLVDRVLVSDVFLTRGDAAGGPLRAVGRVPVRPLSAPELAAVASATDTQAKTAGWGPVEVPVASPTETRQQAAIQTLLSRMEVALERMEVSPATLDKPAAPAKRLCGMCGKYPAEEAQTACEYCLGISPRPADPLPEPPLTLTYPLPAGSISTNDGGVDLAGWHYV